MQSRLSGFDGQRLAIIQTRRAVLHEVDEVEINHEDDAQLDCHQCASRAEDEVQGLTFWGKGMSSFLHRMWQLAGSKA